jgi:hypothetical protein
VSGNAVENSAVLNHRRIAIVEGVLGLLAALACAFFASKGAELSSAMLGAAALLLLVVGWRTWQIAATVADLDARIDRKQSALAYLTSRDSGRLGWAKQAVVLCVSEHYVYLFRATVSAREPEARVAYGDLMEFDLGSGRTAALLRVGLPAKTYLLGGLLWPEVAAVEQVLGGARPDLLVESIAERLEAMGDD